MATCAICGRETQPYVMIGREAIGPTCAKKAGLHKVKPIKGSAVRFVAQKPTGHHIREPETLDLFADDAVPIGKNDVL